MKNALFLYDADFVNDQETWKIFYDYCGGVGFVHGALNGMLMFGWMIRGQS